MTNKEKRTELSEFINELKEAYNKDISRGGARIYFNDFDKRFTINGEEIML